MVRKDEKKELHKFLCGAIELETICLSEAQRKIVIFKVHSKTYIFTLFKEKLWHNSEFFRNLKW